MRYKIPVSVEQFESVNEDKKKNEEKKNNKKAIVDKTFDALKNLESDALDAYVSKSYKFDYLKTDDRTDEELEKIAEKAVGESNAEKAEILTKDTATKKQDLNSEIQKNTEKFNEESTKISKVYDDAKQTASNEALRRGLGRSSIIMNMLKDYDQGKINSIDSKSKEYNQKISELDSEIKLLDNSLSDALKKLDMESAFKINEQLDKLKKERDDNNEKVIKYNNQINELLGEYKRNLIETKEGKAVLEGVKETAQDYKKQITLGLMDYYDELDLEEAKADFAKQKYANYLDENHLKLIENYFARRKQ